MEHRDLLPEGGAWLLHLNNGADIFVELCSYEVKNEDVRTIWIEFSPSANEVIAEINKTNGEIIKEIIIKPKEIADFYPRKPS